MISFDPYDPALTEPAVWPVYAAARAAGAVRSVDRDGFWMLTRYADVQEALLHPESFSSASGHRLPTDGTQDAIPIDYDPPRHGEYRRLMREVMATRRVRALRPFLRSVIGDLVARFHERGGGDVVREIALPMPLLVLTEVVGFSPATVARFRTVTEQMWEGIAADPVEANRQIVDLMREELAEHRRERPDDFVTRLLDARIEGRPLDEDEQARILATLAVAGHETTMNAAGGLVHLLVGHPEAQERLRADPALAPRFVEEMLRLRSPAQNFARRTTCPVSVSGSAIPAGAAVLLSFAAANRDPERYLDPDRFDPDRDTRGHLAFGWGIHLCLGAALARAELVILLEELARHPPLRLAGEVAWSGLRGGNHLGPVRLPVEFGEPLVTGRRVAVVGAGPSGLYAAAALADAGAGVDVLDRLPAPYGLVRYGVAPDHLKMKAVTRVLQRPFGTADVRFLGNVPVGAAPGLPLELLRRCYHAVVVATGSSVDRGLGVPGEDLRGSVGSGEFVGWYCGHPDRAGFVPPLDHPAAVVVGAGNVALDVTRILARSRDELAATDVPDRVLDALQASAVRDVHVLVRRGPGDARFTPAEVRALGELAEADVVVHGEEVHAAAADADRRQRQNLEILTAWSGRAPRDRPRRIHLRFLRSPVRLVGSAGRVTGVVVERTRSVGGRVVGTGEVSLIEAGLVVRAIGYTARPLPGLPFDPVTGTVPNNGGRVLDDGGRPTGTYVTGWIKRGPSGVIGTNKADALETVAHLLADLPRLPPPPRPDRAAVLDVLAARGVDPVDWTAWLRLDAEERRRGAPRGAERVKVAELEAMLTACRAC